MSITLEGKATAGEETGNWSGLWRFTKEKKSFLAYTYEKSGHVIPRDLFDYVSFANEPPSAITPAPPGRKSKDKSKALKAKAKPKSTRGRGRPPSISEPAVITIPTTDASVPPSMEGGAASAPTANKEQRNDEQQEGNEQNNNSDNEDEDGGADSDAENGEGSDGENNESDGENAQDDGADEKAQNNNDTDNAGTQQTSQPMDLSEPSTEPTAGITAPVDASKPTEPKPLGPDVVLEGGHPMLGMWEGTFNVKTTTGEESVPEKFFFYATQNSTASIAGEPLLSRPESLRELPPDPVFPYALLPTPAAVGGVGALLLGLPLTVVPVVAASGASAGEAQAQNGSGSVATAQVKEEKSAPGDTSSAVAAGAEGSSAQDGAPPASHPGPTISLLSPDVIVLLGFGRNAFGRFSVAGIYDEKTGELRCEKKYMVTKFSAKRGRRSYAECAATAAATGGYPLLSVGVGGGYGLHAPAAPLVPPSTRQRLAPTAHSQYLEDFDDAESGHKRKRGLSTSNLARAGSGVADPYASTGKGWKSVGKSSKENTQAQAAAAHAAAIAAAGPNALIGARNPDNDDPDASYREAFMDCDSGEVYEGGWYYGTRHGKGICLYSDGLMYEGNWVANREHGKGILMTGDRQIIYTGDWLEGNMHGFGTYYFGNGDRYAGDWKEGTRHGKGDYTFRNGCRYSGEWKDNRRSGRGVFVWPDGSYYSGDWEYAQRHGRGKLELANGFMYDGQWVRNVIEGKGICRFPGGQEYEGTYKNGLREGRGTITFAEGAVYEGRFREDRFDGQGTLKVQRVVPGAQPDEIMIPLQVQSDFWRIHLRAGFGNDPH